MEVTCSNSQLKMEVLQILSHLSLAFSSWERDGEPIDAVVFVE